jgi:hypothetical protein
VGDVASRQPVTLTAGPEVPGGAPATPVCRPSLVVSKLSASILWMLNPLSQSSKTR